jgi:hypothetical protein
MNLQDTIRKVLKEEIKSSLKLRRVLSMLDYEVEYKVKGLEQFLGSTVLQLNRAIDAVADAADAAEAEARECAVDGSAADDGKAGATLMDGILRAARRSRCCRRDKYGSST